MTNETSILSLKNKVNLSEIDAMQQDITQHKRRLNRAIREIETGQDKTISEFTLIGIKAVCDIASCSYYINELKEGIKQ